MLLCYPIELLCRKIPTYHDVIWRYETGGLGMRFYNGALWTFLSRSISINQELVIPLLRLGTLSGSGQDKAIVLKKWPQVTRLKPLKNIMYVLYNSILDFLADLISFSTFTLRSYAILKKKYREHTDKIVCRICLLIG